MRVQILDEAEQDLVEGCRFYEAHERGLGNYFLDTLFSDIDSLQLYAGIHPRKSGYYRMLSKRFPFAIYYRIDSKTVRVRAILDCRRDPELPSFAEPANEPGIHHLHQNRIKTRLL